MMQCYSDVIYGHHPHKFDRILILSFLAFRRAQGAAAVKLTKNKKESKNKKKITATKINKTTVML